MLFYGSGYKLRTKTAPDFKLVEFLYNNCTDNYMLINFLKIVIDTMSR
jgi:hypothetical protein